MSFEWGIMNLKIVKKKIILLKNSLLISYGFSKAGIVKSLRKKGILRKISFDDVIVISYPKSGRTWLRVMLDYMDINLKFDHKLKDVKHVKSLHPKTAHDFWKKFGDKRIIFLTRDPKDTLVSSYFQAINREKTFEGSISEFIRSPEFGIQTILDYQLTWTKYRSIYKNFLRIQYDEMQKDTAGTLEKIIVFLGFTTINKKKLEKTVELFQFDNMQFYEKKGLLGLRYGNVLRPLGDKSNNSLKVRKGVIGGYKEYLSEEDVEYCDACSKEMGFIYQ